MPYEMTTTMWLLVLAILAGMWVACMLIVAAAFWIEHLIRMAQKKREFIRRTWWL